MKLNFPVCFVYLLYSLFLWFCFVFFLVIYDQGSQFPIVPPPEDLESAFRKKKDRKVDKSSSSFHVDKFESFEKTPEKKGTGYEP